MDSRNTSHSDHAFLSPSKYHWIRYDKEKLVKAFYNYLAVERGTRLHEVAAELIDLKRWQPKNDDTFNMYVNDAIKFKMEPEKKLWFSENLYGTADALAFTMQTRSKKAFLRIHDLKTGVTPAHFEQLMIYAGLYCLINHLDPFDVDFELRLYQSNDIQIMTPDSSEISEMIEVMLEADKTVSEIRAQESGYVY